MTDLRATPVSLHTAARRYLAERYERWTSRYAEIGGSPSDGYTDQELDIFPRYNVLAAILAAVERLTPNHWTSLEEAREHLTEAGRGAESPFTRPPFGAIEDRAMAEEREHGPNYEIELSEFDPSYTGAEGFWSSAELDWLLYASHESSITVGGESLIAAITQAWPEWHQYIWTTPFF